MKTFFKDKNWKKNIFIFNNPYFENVKRVDSIDAFRGFCVFCMLFFQFLDDFPSLGILSRLASHDVDDGIVILPGMTIADFIAPAFIFAIGLTFTLSFYRRQKRAGTLKAFIHCFERGLAIIGLGTFLEMCLKYFQNVFAGKGFSIDIIICTVFSIIAIISLILRIIFSCLKDKNLLLKIFTHMFYISLSILGIISIVFTSIDWHLILQNKDIILADPDPDPGKFQKFMYWVTLQGIGFSIVIATPFVVFNRWFKLVAAILIGLGYSVYHNIGSNRILLDGQVHGGVLGGFGWGSMLLFSMFIGDSYYKSKEFSISFSAFMAALGIILIPYVGEINLDTCSPTFILVTIGLSGIVFAFFDLISKFFTWKFKPFVSWGKNPIIMFLVEFFTFGLYGEIAEDINEKMPLWLASIAALIGLAFLLLIAYGLSKLKKNISL